MLVLGYILAAVAAYLLGSIPTGYLVGRQRGIDIRNAGSGNIGATNVFRVLGKGLGMFVFAVDVLKGYAACEVVGVFGFKWFGDGTVPVHEYFAILAGFVAVVGHNFTCWLDFRGGKGIATSAGVMLALFPKALLVVLGIWALIFAVSRYVSLASIAGAFWLPVFVLVFGYAKERFWVSVIMTALAIYKHKSNIQRLIAGTEHRFGDKPEPPKEPPPSTSVTSE